MAEQEINEVDDEKSARGGKRTSETKVAEVSTSNSKKRAKKALAVTPEPAQAQNIFMIKEDILKNTKGVRALRKPPKMWPTEKLR